MGNAKGYEPFQGFRSTKPFQLVSLSGGGYRAALFHAGVMRALRVADILTQEGLARQHVVIAAVSGGSIPAMLWQAFIDEGGNDWWPEAALLDLVTHGPTLPRFGTFGLYLAGNAFRKRWAAHLERWWAIHASKLKRSNSDSFGARRLLTIVELLDFESGKIFGICNGRVIDPDREFFKYGAAEPLDLMFEHGELTAAQAMFAATAFPAFFAPWNDRGIGRNISQRGSYQFIDAGLIDNCAVLPFISLIASPLWQAMGPSNWLISDAGAPIAMRDEPKHALAMAVTKKGAALQFRDRLLRVAGDLSQRAYFGALMNVLHSAGAVNDLRAIRAGTESESRVLFRGTAYDPEPPWLNTPRLVTPEAFANAPTSLGPMRRDDSVAILCHGAQVASLYFGLSQSQRENLKTELSRLL